MYTVEQQVHQRAEFSRKHHRPGVDRIVREGGENLWNNVRMYIRNITGRFMNSDQPTIVFEIDLHDLWYLAIETAKITPTGKAAADRLVSQIVAAKELGVLTRDMVPKDTFGSQQDSKETEAETVFMSNGARLWVDMPFLVADLRAAWVDSIYEMSVTERENLAGFTSRLSASGICGPQMTLCVLMLFREALETSRRILQSDEPVSTSQAPEIPLADFMPAVFAWLYWGGYQVWDLCSRHPSLLSAELSDTDRDWVAVGQLPSSQGINEPGLTRSRMQFWESRLEEVANTTQDKDLSEQCRRCVSILSEWDNIMGGRKRGRFSSSQPFSV